MKNGALARMELSLSLLLHKIHPELRTSNSALSSTKKPSY